MPHRLLLWGGNQFTDCEDWQESRLPGEPAHHPAPDYPLLPPVRPKRERRVRPLPVTRPERRQLPATPTSPDRTPSPAVPAECA